MKNIGTLITAPIRINDSTDTYASAFSNEIRGGVHTLKSVDEFNDITLDRQQVGMLCYITNSNSYYRLIATYSDTSAAISSWKKLNIADYSDASNHTTEWVNSVIKITTNEADGEKTVGNRYLLGMTCGVSVTGVNWKNYAAAIVEYDGSVWNTTLPTNGTCLKVDNEPNMLYRFYGTYSNNTSTGTWKRERNNQILYIASYYNSTTNTYNATISDTILSSYNKESMFMTSFDTNCLMSGPKLSINGLSAKEIRKVTNDSLIQISTGGISTNHLCMLIYDGTYFNMYDNTSIEGNNLLIKYYIPKDETVTVPVNTEYMLYGDLKVDGTLNNAGKVVVVNGDTNITGETGVVASTGDIIFVNFAEISGVGTKNYIPRWKSDFVLSSTSSIIDDGINSVTISSNTYITKALNVQSGTTLNGSLTIPTGAYKNYVLVSDNAGNAKWTNIQDVITLNSKYIRTIPYSDIKSKEYYYVVHPLSSLDVIVQLQGADGIIINSIVTKIVDKNTIGLYTESEIKQDIKIIIMK